MQQPQKLDFIIISNKYNEYDNYQKVLAKGCYNYRPNLKQMNYKVLIVRNQCQKIEFRKAWNT